MPGIKARIYSFATKYCSHHKPYFYPIYDSYVHRFLVGLKQQYHFDTFNDSDLKNYERFKKVILNFQNFFNLGDYTVKQIDKYLWQAGKEYFKR